VSLYMLCCSFVLKIVDLALRNQTVGFKWQMSFNEGRIERIQIRAETIIGQILFVLDYQNPFWELKVDSGLVGSKYLMTAKLGLFCYRGIWWWSSCSTCLWLGSIEVLGPRHNSQFSSKFSYPSYIIVIW